MWLSVDAKAVITDLVNPIQTLQYSCPEISPFKVFEHLVGHTSSTVNVLISLFCRFCEFEP